MKIPAGSTRFVELYSRFEGNILDRPMPSSRESTNPSLSGSMRLKRQFILSSIKYLPSYEAVDTFDISGKVFMKSYLNVFGVRSPEISICFSINSDTSSKLYPSSIPKIFLSSSKFLRALFCTKYFGFTLKLGLFSSFSTVF